jgi:hypothetical protein
VLTLSNRLVNHTPPAPNFCAATRATHAILTHYTNLCVKIKDSSLRWVPSWYMVYCCVLAQETGETAAIQSHIRGCHKVARPWAHLGKLDLAPAVRIPVTNARKHEMQTNKLESARLTSFTQAKVHSVNSCSRSARIRFYFLFNFELETLRIFTLTRIVVFWKLRFFLTLSPHKEAYCRTTGTGWIGDGVTHVWNRTEKAVYILHWSACCWLAVETNIVFVIFLFTVRMLRQVFILSEILLRYVYYIFLS